jgi:hypothetical protein
MKMLQDLIIPNRLRSYEVSLINLDQPVEEANIEHYFWYQTSVDRISKVKIKIGSFIELILDQLVCVMCHNYTSSIDLWGFCKSCQDLVDEDFKIRMSCIFNHKNSFLTKSGGCTKDNYPCKIIGNKQKCHSRHILYFGRFGSIVKVGVSRKQRSGGYMARILEQGFQEVLIVDSLPSLPEALAEEQNFKKMGIIDVLDFQEKLDQIQINLPQNSLHQAFYELLEEYFAPLTIHYHSIHQKYHQDIRSMVSTYHVEGKIIDIIGDIIIIEGINGIIAYQAKQLINFEILLLRLNNKTLIGEV